mgnify:CR=1 FL=1
MSERQREITLRFLTGVPDINIYGKVHGGAVMKWIDEALNTLLSLAESPGSL